MIQSIYEFLRGIGFFHPLHPAITHIPMGMIVGGFLFFTASRILRREALAAAAHSCFTLALIFILPTMLTGIMDWQVLQDGKWIFLIKLKITLACLLTVLLAIAVKIGSQPVSSPTLRAALYLLCLLAAVGLGFSGGEILYG